MQGQYPPPQGQYPGQWGQPYYGPGQFNSFHPPRRRGGPLRLVLLGSVLLIFIGVSVAVLAALLGNQSTDDTAEPEVSGPSIVPTATTTPEKGTAEDFLLNADIYRTGSLVEQNCKAAPLGNGSLAAQKAYYTKLFKCLNDGWRPIFHDLGQDKPDPGLVVFDQPVKTPCGNFEPLSGRVLAFYCYGNQVMYVDVKQMNRAFGPKQDLAYLMTIAHEYGHHVQGVSGLFYARMAYLQDHPEQKLESSRRNEVQASCFAGVFSKSVEKSYPLTNRLDEFKQQSSNSFGDSPDSPADERTHGQATTQGFWIQNGFNIGANKACDTYAVSADLVK
ncbi:neutral zinc metallopeptidase [Kribbella solani]|uniref:neutral zinc metallopeptidase n=1 Tax=Kribbella solani TaxID=236067 RepID=UPI0029B2D19E|nr:neutral zinc metallopeptidase [Kribbella solani]MDX2973101.1 neutral zinc metallopeptidase [Kribbella solani]MDX3003560.1 neutral zinc metallopeptidase [Kribbella solani]